ncbi:hypothetical protein Tco_1003634 [Tanacetum coccineum]|uniref:Uncharacterized protein n=1 Tax=Tanacetum coccineum TaxID=301880 RepID=A0ABQ5FA02_9ASTR
MELKYQNQALKSGQHGHALKDIDEIETINIDLEHSVAKLLLENEHLNKENEHLKLTYKDLFDSILPSRAQTQVHNDSLVAFRHLRDTFSVVFGLLLTQDTVMLDFEDSTVTYTAMSSPFGELPDIGSPGVGWRQPVIQGRTHIAYVYHISPWSVCSGAVSRSNATYEDEILPAEEQPLPAAVSPTVDSPNYVPESGDDDDDEDESSDDDEDEDVDIEGEEEEHPAPSDSTTVALPAVDQAPSAEETEPFETDESAATPPPHPAYRVTARISPPPPPPPPPPYIDETSISLPPREEVEKLLAMPTPLSSPLSPWSSPLPYIPSPPLPVSSPVPVVSPSPPASPIRPLGYRVAMIRLRAEAASTSHSLHFTTNIILPSRPDANLSSGNTTFASTLLLTVRADRLEVTLPPQKRLGIVLGPRYEVEESPSAAARQTGGLRADYGFVATMDREIMRDLERGLYDLGSPTLGI